MDRRIILEIVCFYLIQRIRKGIFYFLLSFYFLSYFIFFFSFGITFVELDLPEPSPYVSKVMVRGVER